MHIRIIGDVRKAHAVPYVGTAVHHDDQILCGVGPLHQFVIQRLVVSEMIQHFRSKYHAEQNAFLHIFGDSQKIF